HAVVVSDLKDQRSIVREQMKMRSDPSFGQRNQFQHDIRQGEQEQFPDEYKKLLSAYYQALSQQNWQGQ
ncbi:MAG: hypothetical protein NTW86_32905, partial [Candidatus Sumerlaeota bacterium]|nr:hypothetical protein [Candidatus Sumerlaeota bacterium]